MVGAAPAHHSYGVNTEYSIIKRKPLSTRFENALTDAKVFLLVFPSSTTIVLLPCEITATWNAKVQKNNHLCWPIFQHLCPFCLLTSPSLSLLVPWPSFPVYSALARGLKSADATKMDFSFTLHRKRNSVTISTVFKRANGKILGATLGHGKSLNQSGFQEQYLNSTTVKTGIKHQWFCSSISIYIWKA